MFIKCKISEEDYFRLDATSLARHSKSFKDLAAAKGDPIVAVALLAEYSNEQALRSAEAGDEIEVLVPKGFLATLFKGKTSYKPVLTLKLPES